MNRRDEARQRLLEWLKPGDTVQTVLRHVSRSGMYRVIDAFVDLPDGSRRYLSRNILDLGIGSKPRENAWGHGHEGVGVGGCGMDMGFHLVYELGRALWPDGVPCAGRNCCHSNDHVNSGPQRDKYGKRVKHRDSGYALRQRWV